ncbi:MAG: hypothetical protein EOP87_00510 [Verrucomicrobiaceae bacterium]|nr:MAG: hypothetical protein EOP87_00510 [Verrucomicrobiaceae bacterium]
MNRLASPAFRDDVQAAQQGVSVYLAKYPTDRMLKSICVQLDYIIEWSEKGAWPEDPKLDKLNFGLMASHTLEALDPVLAMQLYLLSNEIRKRYE